MPKNNTDMIDVLGIGLGPFNLSLAALLKPLVDQNKVKACFLEKKPQFDWHPGLLLDGTTLQVPFMADLVTMADPTSPFTYLNYLHEEERLYRFYFREDFLVPRREYNMYCQWVAKQLEYIRFNQSVENIQWLDSESCFEVTSSHNQETRILRAKHLVLGIGSSPSIPKALRELAEKQPHKVFHTAQLLNRLDNIGELTADKHVTVLGSGQSAAEAFQAVLEKQNDKGFSLDWFTRSAGFFPMEYSKLGLQHFTPDYIQYIRRLSQQQRDDLIPTQGLLYKGISAFTIAQIHDRLYELTIGGKDLPISLLAHCDLVEARPSGSSIVLQFHHREQNLYFEQITDMVVSGTGYASTSPAFLKGITDAIEWDEQSRYQINDQYQLYTDFQNHQSQIYIQNGELHTHGISAPDLGLGAHRSAVIINTLMNKRIYKVREKNSCMDFGVSERRDRCKLINKLDEAV